VGRQLELAALTDLLARERLVTVVGPGGSGKTRLVVEGAGRDAASVCGFVELSAVGPPADPAMAVLAGCGLREEPGLDATELLRERLGQVAGLLLLDTCEHLRVEVSHLVTELLRHCQTLRVLATSRVSLGAPGEVVLPLTGLATAREAEMLFLDRARRVQPALPEGSETDTVVAEICRLVDGLPLAIELAAAHARSLPLRDIRDGMTDRLNLLVARAPGARSRHASLVSSLDWSVDLVGEAARQALIALSVVEGRFPLEVATAITGGAREAVQTLVDHSLVQFDPADGMYRLLDTVREYTNRSAQPREVEAAHTRLLAWVTDFAVKVRVGLEHAEPDALHRASCADGAVASALDRAIQTGAGLEAAAAIAADLAFGWSLRGRCGEALIRVRGLTAALDRAPAPLRWAHAFLTVYSGDLESGFGLAAAVGQDEGCDERSRARSLILVGMVQGFGDPAGAEPVLANAAALARAADDDWGHVEAIQCCAYSHLFRGTPQPALAYADSVTPVLARLGHGQLRAWDEAIRAEVAAMSGRFEDAHAHGRAGWELAVAVGEPVSAAGAWLPLLRALVATGCADEAAIVCDAGRRFLEARPSLLGADSIALAEAIVASSANPASAASAAHIAIGAVTAPHLAAEASVLLGRALLRAADSEGALAACAQAAIVAGAVKNRGVAIAADLVQASAHRQAGNTVAAGVHDLLLEAHQLGLRPLVADGLDVAAALANDEARPAVAARLHAAAAGLRSLMGVRPMPPVWLAVDAQPLRAPQFAAARAEGARLGVTGAVGYAVRSRGRRNRPRTGWDSLTPAELEVVALVGRGLSNPDIGAELLVSSGTVRTHLRSVFVKLAVTSRAELAVRAATRDL
jgi:predicted ATPase/DNA-binding CsgD family transcriptional regulator